jgi:type I restriction enzyme S subunit
MASEWRTARFAEICEHSAFGPRFGGELYATDGNVATLRTTDISEDGRIEYNTMPLARLDLAKFRQHFLRANDLVITRSGRIGTAALFEGFRLPVLPGAFLIRFRLKSDRADPRFYRYFFNSPAGQELLTSIATGSVQQNLNITSVHGLEVPVPPLSEQRTIARILGTLDDKIELNRQMNETLEAMARALFKSWFVDFDPVRAKAEGRDPGLPKEIADLFPNRFEDSELGEIPMGWKLGTLGHVATNPRRGVQPSEIEETTPYIALEHMPKCSIALSEWGTANGLESNKFEFKQGEILFGKLRPYFHKVGVAPVDGVCSTDILVVAPRAERWFGFVLGHVSSATFVEHTSAGSTGTKMPRTSWGDMERYSVVLPPDPVAEAFTERICPSVARIVASIHQSRTLVALRDTLLPKLISGELRVKDAERFVGGVGGMDEVGSGRA